MAKDLPYFKFFCSEWTDGDITLEDYETQGLFINVCSYYWSNNCNLELIKLKKRFRNDANLNNLIEAKIIKINGTFVYISFLDKQLIEREEQSSTKSRGGKASAEAKRLLKIKQQFSTNSTDNQHVLNYSSTESQHMLKSCSTESQVLRKEEIREEEIRKENIINNAVFVSECKNSTQWIEVTAMQNKVSPEIVNIFLTTFENHLITMQEQKKTVKEYKEHFTHWMKKQDLSNFREKIVGKTNQI